MRKLPRTAWQDAQVREVMTPAAALSVVTPEAEINDAWLALGPTRDEIWNKTAM